MFISRGHGWAVIFLAAFSAAYLCARAEIPPDAGEPDPGAPDADPAAASTNELAETNIVPVQVIADSLEFDSQKNLVIGTGRAKASREKDTLRADFITVDLDTHDAWARGHVTFESESDQWVGEKLHYNFLTKRGDFGDFESFFAPFFIRAKTSKRISDSEFQFKNAIFTTCEGDRPAAHFTARSVRLIPGRHIYAKHVFLYIGAVPVMYFPYWAQNIGDPNFFSFMPGYSRRMGPFLLTAFNYRLSRNIEASTHFDFRGRRGVAVGQDVLWSASGNSKGLSTEIFQDHDDDDWFIGKGFPAVRRSVDDYDPWFGDAVAYYANDKNPDEDDPALSDISNDRFRLRLYNSSAFTNDNYFLAQASYASDREFIEQYFRDEYQADPEPNNYMVLMHRGDQYTASVKVERHLSDFYETIDRLPELSLDVARTELFESPFYYEGKTSGGYMQRFNPTSTNYTAPAFLSDIPEYSDTNRTSLGRFDSMNMLYFSKKYFGFLNLTPRAGYRGTWYSKTKEDRHRVTETRYVNTNGIEVVRIVTNRFSIESGGDWRSLFELGAEASMKAFKVWETRPGPVINDIRHIVEPYVNYTYVPEPNVAPSNLFQFDEVDELDKYNGITIGMRNKLQTKHTNIYDLVYLDVWTAYMVDPDPGQNDFTNIFFKAESRPFDDVELRIDGSFNQYESLLEKLNTRVKLLGSAWRFDIEHRYRVSNSSHLSGRLLLSPGSKWAFQLYGSYQFEDGYVEQYGGWLQRNMGCLAGRLGYEWEDDDYTVWIQFWFSDFPRVIFDVGA